MPGQVGHDVEREMPGQAGLTRNTYLRKMRIFAADYKGKTICRATCGEESPDRAGHPAAESADGSNLIRSVTENNRRKYLSPRF